MVKYLDFSEASYSLSPHWFMPVLLAAFAGPLVLLCASTSHPPSSCGSLANIVSLHFSISRLLAFPCPILWTELHWVILFDPRMSSCLKALPILLEEFYHIVCVFVNFGCPRGVVVLLSDGKTCLGTFVDCDNHPRYDSVQVPAMDVTILPWWQFVTHDGVVVCAPSRFLPG